MHKSAQSEFKNLELYIKKSAHKNYKMRWKY